MREVDPFMVSVYQAKPIDLSQPADSTIMAV